VGQIVEELGLKKLLAVAAVLGTALMVFLIREHAIRVDTSFASRVYLRYHYLDKAIDVKITDASDVAVLKAIINGRSYRDNPACGFTSDVSITFSDGRKSLVFCPACDGCPVLQIGGTDRYISISKSNRNRLHAIVRKYGMTFPCV